MIIEVVNTHITFSFKKVKNVLFFQIVYLLCLQNM